MNTINVHIDFGDKEFKVGELYLSSTDASLEIAMCYNVTILTREERSVQHSFVPERNGWSGGECRRPSATDQHVQFGILRVEDALPRGVMQSTPACKLGKKLQKVCYHGWRCAFKMFWVWCCRVKVYFIKYWIVLLLTSIYNFQYNYIINSFTWSKNGSRY